jgi:Tetratricopeptide repeat
VILNRISTKLAFCFLISLTALEIGTINASLLPAYAQTDDAALLTTQIVKLHGEGRYSEAVPLALRLLGLRENALGPDHVDVAASLNILAELYRVQGNLAAAEPLFKRSLAIREKALGPNHVDFA